MNVLKFITGNIQLAITPKSTIALQNEKLFYSAILRVDKIKEIDTVLNKLMPKQDLYETVAKKVNKDMPWWFVLMVHAMEAGHFANPFNYHLHCGDPLTSRTFHVPKGRPKHNPRFGASPPTVKNPYSWEESALDALMLLKYNSVKDWSLGNILWLFEEFNGLGYRKYHKSVPTPYVWSYTSIYSKGKYVADGKFDNNAISRQPGCAAFLLRLKQLGRVGIV